MTEVSIEERRARALGAYLGFAVGDALGATVEFLSAEEIAERHGVHRRMIGGGWLGLKRGQVTDDTEMCLALGRAILARGGFDLSAMAEEFVRWYRSRPVDIGATCLQGIRRYLTDGSLAAGRSRWHGGNGACLRNLPVILATLRDEEAFRRWTIDQCHFTHNHPFSDAATLALGEMVRRLLSGAGVAAAREAAERLVARHPVFSYEPFPVRSSGYVVDTIQTVLFTFFGSHSFASCLIATVNRGGDADSTGALAGMLAGARYTIEGIPRGWRRRLSRTVTEEIERQVDGLLALADSRAG
ncbi:ADP-ribosyl-[dinitrogen reductase] glycohydrolase [Methylacidimicrobium cyclopophantes]|uniref:ADP-ribosyl-[dinitrogen reductase] glycohydrolase n=1 Tax=Methylacidimicrobium cyclopophantes TaxID=1041766 RepID=A0A5E6MDX4_9BACT|nr:ADP-ribosyl-[dinitrogen reductase] hydrolase [Methylacidimicrobium cyclopophantes]VVM06022.1 ADP-ribosyl-[dinitrogen reductase] glycohydrolase [Methylacidimicrobium cyclopophantes]